VASAKYNLMPTFGLIARAMGSETVRASRDLSTRKSLSSLKMSFAEQTAIFQGRPRAFIAAIKNLIKTERYLWTLVNLDLKGHRIAYIK